MNAAQMRSLLQLVGVTCIAYALYNVWEAYESLAEPLLVGGLAEQPFLWIGMALIVLPYVAMLLLFLQSKTLRAAPTVMAETHYRCSSCGQSVPSSAKVCRQCGEFQL